ncbi:glycine--tRNA ligase [Candidatus Parcubacteria bacterium]|nr:glycine--tRNA ligase [Candidatus Parcubacteria bacterium]
MVDDLEKIISLAKRRGFVFLSSEIYGGFSSCYDLGPLGVEMKNNLKKLWWNSMTKRKETIFGMDASILMSPKVWEASGHLSAGFADELVECKNCHKRFKKDDTTKNKCPECKGELLPPRKFNLMMKTFVGPVEDEASVSYLRPETCQGIYVNFKNLVNSMRLKIPFGICQIGKAFRNEITPRNFLFRIREFEQMEMQWFCEPKEAEFWFDFWLKERIKWLESLGISKERINIFEVPKEQRAHYAKRQIDIQYKFPFGWKEIEGVHNRGDWDLSNHSRYSGIDLSVVDPNTNKKYFPYVIETSIGIERLILALLCEAYEEIKGGRTKTTTPKKEVEIVLKLDKKVAPIKVAVFPLVKKEKRIVKKAKEIYEILKLHFPSVYDEAGSIGRRYRRVDEIGCPFAITVDFESLEKNDVTVRDRDSMEQERIPIPALLSYLKEKFHEEI